MITFYPTKIYNGTIISTVLLLMGLFTKASAQAPDFRIKFSEPLAVFEFVEYLSANAPDNLYKKAFKSSTYNQPKYQALIASYDRLTTDYGYEYTAYPYGQKIGGSTQSLLKRSLINCDSVCNLKVSALGIIPNSDLFMLINILTEFEPVYQQLIYQPNKQAFEQQLITIKALIVSKNIASYFLMGQKFYNSTWDNTIPFNLVFYPLPGTKHFLATAFYNEAVTALPVGLTDHNSLLSVMLHETFHVLYDEQSLAFKQNIEQWFTSNPSKNSRYAYLLLNEALATSLGNGYVYGKLNNGVDTGAWYHRKYTSAIAKKIYPLVKEYAAQQKPIDKSFVDNYIKLYDENFSGWLVEKDNILTDRYILTDTASVFDVIDQKFPYRSMSQYDNGITGTNIQKMKLAPITKVVIITKDNDSKLALLKNSFDDLKNWKPDNKADFNYSIWLRDKTYLIIINVVKKTVEDHLETLRLDLP